MEVKTVHISYATNVGKVRQANEDNFYVDSAGIRISENEAGSRNIELNETRVFAVCDGMGGEAYGEEASRIVASTLLEMISEVKASETAELDKVMEKFVQAANDRICEMRLEKRCGISGSTLAMLCMCEKNVFTYNLGDSKVFRFSEGKLTQISEDQTVAARKVKANIYTEEEARKSSDFFKLTAFVGMDDRGVGIRPLSYAPIPLTTQKFLLCSDGLTDMCENEEIAEVLEGTELNKAEVLVERAMQHGGEDNITCIVVELQ